MAKATKPTKASKVRAYQEKNPKASATQVAKATGVDIAYIYAIRHSDKKPNVKVPKQLKWRHVTVAPKDEALEGAARLEANRVYELTKGRERVRPIMVDLRQDADGKITEKVTEVTMEEPKADNVNHPAHYKVGGIETIDFIEAKGLNYHLGNVVKYITRADTKGNREEDLLKARWYLNREIAKFTK